MNTNTKELDLNELENISGGAESAPNSNGNFISWIIDLLFGD